MKLGVIGYGAIGRHVEAAGPRPALIARDFEQVDDVERIVGELDLKDRPTAGVRDSHRRAD